MAAKKTNEVKKEIEATELKAKNAVKAAAAKTKAAAKKTAEDTRVAVTLLGKRITAVEWSSVSYSAETPSSPAFTMPREQVAYTDSGSPYR